MAFVAVIAELSIDDDVWRAAYVPASCSRRAGKKDPASDIVVFACAPLGHCGSAWTACLC